MVRLVRRFFVAMAGLLMAGTGHADVAVIVHPDSPVQTLTARQVSDLYLGRARTLGLQEPAASTRVLEHLTDSPLRERFYRALNGMDIRQVNAYWARLRFSGEVLPPPKMPDSRAVVEAVGGSREAIGYVDATAVTSAVRIVLQLKE